ncbi:MAG: TylF/MycF/NovP-related O-methyltransferase [Paracoccaceae bacterium]
MPPIIITALRALSSKNRLRRNLPDKNFYKPLFQPWLGYGEFSHTLSMVSKYSLVSNDRIWVLNCLAKQALHVEGEFWECGVYKGGTAMMLAQVVSTAKDKKLRLFDTFEGMPATDPNLDYHREGDFSDNSLSAVRQRVGCESFVEFHAGLIPKTFKDLGSRDIAFAHVDVDIYQSVLDCCEFIYPRLSPGGVLVFDDYGFPSCPGARAAVDGFFVGKPEVPLVLPTGQAVVHKLLCGSDWMST